MYFVCEWSLMTPDAWAVPQTVKCFRNTVQTLKSWSGSLLCTPSVFQNHSSISSFLISYYKTANVNMNCEIIGNTFDSF